MGTQIQYPSTHPSLPVDNTSSCPTRLLTCRPEPRHHRQAMLRREQHLLLYNNWKWTHCAMAAAWPTAARAAWRRTAPAWPSARSLKPSVRTSQALVRLTPLYACVSAPRVPTSLTAAAWLKGLGSAREPIPTKVRAMLLSLHHRPKQLRHRSLRFGPLLLLRPNARAQICSKDHGTTDDCRYDRPCPPGDGVDL